MLAAARLTPSHLLTLQRVYSAFWRLVVGVTHRQAAQVSLQDFVGDLNPDGTANIGNRLPLVIKGISARPIKRRSADYDLYLDFQQRVRGLDSNSSVIFHAELSTVRLLYVQYRNRDDVTRELAEQLEAATIYQGLHFDIAQDAHHPIFHAQVDYGCIKAETIGRRCKIATKRCDAPRVPTAPLDLAGVVYMLLHDHFPEKVVGGWPPSLKAAAAALPQLPLGDFAYGFPLGTRMDSAWWYPTHP